jgi:segregation and condensation protein B
MEKTTSSEFTLDIRALIEALLFIASNPVSINQLATTLNVSNNQIEKALLEIESRFSEPQMPFGIRLQKHHGRYQLISAPQAASVIEQFLGLETTSYLSPAALETLAVIAYKEPITRPQIDAIRGVNSDGVLRTLLSKGLIQEIGRAETPGRPILYTVSNDFLNHFGLSSLEELPPLENDINTNDNKDL